MSETTTADDLRRRIIYAEWEQFQVVDNVGGPAECQNNWPMFQQMRASQFLTWPYLLLASYAGDLDRARRTGRNLVMEKYARMMETTDPQEYRRTIAPYLPALDDERRSTQERIVAAQVRWAEDFAERYPRLAHNMRTIHTEQDTTEQTSLETYLRGELSTYSDSTLSRYVQFVDDLAAEGENLTEKTVTNTVVLAGFADLETAEAAL